MFHSDYPLQPKVQGEPLQVVFIGRISTEHQNEESIEASFEWNEKYLRSRYHGPVEITCLGERGSGWKIKREAIQEAEHLIQTRRCDVVIMEDIGRAYRNPQYQFRLAHMCKDHGVRLICPGDGIDTADSNWEIVLGAAVMRHAAHVPDTRRRVRRSADYAFKEGGMVLKVRAFYRKLSAEEALASGGVRIAKLSEFDWVVRDMRLRVLEGQSYAQIGRWLNTLEIPTGAYVVIGEWTGRLVKEFLRDPILYGLRTFRDVEYEMIYSSGEHKRVPNPEPATDLVPELAFMSKAERDEMIAAMDARAAASSKSGPKNRRDIPRKESYWPGQHLTCSCCGGQMYWAGRSVLKCQHAYPGRPQRCWNRVLIDADVLRAQLLPRLLQEIRRRPALYQAMIDSLWDAHQRAAKQSDRGLERLDRDIGKLDREIKRITSLLIEASESNALMGRLVEAESRQKVLQAERAQMTAAKKERYPIESREGLQERIEPVILHLAATSYEFAALMRSMFPDLRLIPVVAVGTAQVRPRVRLSLPADPESGIGLSELVVDAFECSAAITYAVQCSQLHREHPEWTRTRIGAELGISKKLVCDAIRYARLLEELGVTDPFVELVDPPARASRWKRRTGDTDRPDSGLKP